MVKVLQTMFLPFHDHAISSSNILRTQKTTAKNWPWRPRRRGIIYMKDQQEKKKYWKGDMKVQDGP